MNTKHRTEIALPRGWIEERLEQTTPRLSIAALTAFESQLEQLHIQSIILRANLSISYDPNSLKRWIDKFGLAESELLGEIESDLNGTAVWQA